MVAAATQMQPRPAGRFQAFLVAAMVPPFLGAALSDYAYWTSHQIEWSNFASWLTAGGLVFGAAALVFAAANALRAKGAATLLALALLATWILGFINALVHARDAWAVMPTGLVLSLLVALLACGCAVLGFSRLPTGRAP